MDGSDLGQAMSPLKPHDDDQLEKKTAAAEESNLKPLKKAHYVWQIKGNYHLKNSNRDLESRENSASGPSSALPQEMMNCSSEPDDVEPSTSVEHEPAFCELHASQSERDKALFKSLSPLRIATSPISCVVCDTFNENVKRATLNNEDECSRSPPPLASHPDSNLRKWQTRQIAKAFMDNTINCVLEEMGFTPVPESAPDSDPDDVLGSINFPRVHEDIAEEEEEDESVENEGILSAIQRHGLQRHTLQSLPEAGCHFSYSSSSPTRCSTSPPRIWGPNQQIYRPMFEADSPSSSESVSVGSDFGVSAEEQTLLAADIEEDADSSNNSNSEDDAEEMQYNYAPPSSCRCAYLSLSKSKEVELAPSDCINCISMPNSEEDGMSEMENPDEASETPKISPTGSVESDDEISKKRQGKQTDSSCISKRRCVEPNEFSECPSTSSELKTSPGLDAVSTSSNPCEENSPAFGHFDFMDAAVAAAIQKKGLSALTCQDL